MVDTSNKITCPGIVSFWMALTKQTWQLLSPENSGRLRGGQGAKRHSQVAQSVALGLCSHSHIQSPWHQGPQVANSPPSLPRGHGHVDGISVTFNNTDVSSNQESAGNVKKRAHAANPVESLFMSWTLWKTFDNTAALCSVLIHVMDECFHHFQMDISAAAVPQVPAKVFTGSPSLSSDKKLFHVAVQLLNNPLRGGGGGGGEFVRLMKMPFWPTYNFVQSTFHWLGLHPGNIRSRNKQPRQTTPSPCHPKAFSTQVTPSILDSP